MAMGSVTATLTTPLPPDPVAFTARCTQMRLTGTATPAGCGALLLALSPTVGKDTVRATAVAVAVALAGAVVVGVARSRWLW